MTLKDSPPNGLEVPPLPTQHLNPQPECAHCLLEWRAVAGWPNYTVSNRGDVTGPMGPRKLTRSVYGYMTVMLCNGQRRNGHMAHRLVCAAFNGPAPEGRPQVGHLNGVRDDNRAENLAWVSPKENTEHRRLHGRAFFGAGNPNAKLTSAEVLDIRQRAAAGESYVSIAKDLGYVKEWAVRRAALGKSWTP